MRGRILLTLAALAAAPLAAQEGGAVPTSDLRVGERVRVTASGEGHRRVVGAMMLLHPDSIVLDTAVVRRSIPFFSSGAVPVDQFRFATFTTNMVNRLEVSRGASRLKGTRRGLIWGTVLGTAIGITAHVTSGPQIRPLDGAGSEMARVALSGALIGAAAGGVLGFLMPSERWIPVQLPRRGGRGWQAP
ncbi:MAG TPA: hypothetical protein VKA84_28145 [Gemmatimonadaceae bacterium]|nr:hypothetical protein [Gemmatimonadaceae bacterium]